MKTPYSLKKVLLITLSILSICSCNSGGSDNNQTDLDTGREAIGNCNVHGYRHLANMLPANRFWGSEYSVKEYRESTSAYEWYPLELSVLEDEYSLHKNKVYTDTPSDECKEVLSIMVDRYYTYSLDDHEWGLSLTLNYPDFKYDYFNAFNENTPDTKIINEVTPSLSLTFTELEEILTTGNKTTTRVVSESTVKAETMTCETKFQVHTSWKQWSYHSSFDPKTQAINSGGDYYYVTHNAEFTGNHCKFEFQHTFTTKDGIEIPARVYAGLEMLSEDGDQRGYKLNILGIDVL